MLEGDELRGELERLLSAHFAGVRQIVRLEQRPNPYRSSFAIQELDVVLDDGSTLALVMKDLSRRSLETGMQAAKPGFAHDPAREIDVYQRILADAGLGTPRCYGAVADADDDQFWLLLERVPAERLAFIGEFAVWEAVARWLASMHERLESRLPGQEAGSSRLLRYDRDFYGRWMERTQAVVGEVGIRGSPARRLARLAAAYDRLVERLLELPPTIIHGEFYAENVLVARNDDVARICPVDWEMSGVAPGLVDVAGLSAGSWSAAEKRALAAAYYRALERPPLPIDEFLARLALCRIHLALQWASTETTRDRVEHWLVEALDTADEHGVAHW